MFLSCFAKKGTKEGDPKLILPPALIKGNIFGKRVAFKRFPAKTPPKLFEAETQALFLVALSLLSFTLTLSRSFGNPHAFFKNCKKKKEFQYKIYLLSRLIISVKIPEYLLNFIQRFAFFLSRFFKNRGTHPYNFFELIGKVLYA